MSAPFRLLPAPPVPDPPRLDPAQQAVVSAAAVAGCGPLLVLAGPGTGKTTTVVEAIAARVAAGTPADRILALTFSRKAAQDLRARIGQRLQATVAGQSAWTFHSFALALVSAGDEAGPPTVLSGPEQDAVVRDLLAGNAAGEGRVPWPVELSAALPTRGFAGVVRTLLARARAVGLDPEGLRGRSGADAAAWAAAAAFFEEYLDVIEAQGAIDYAELIHRAAVLASGDDPAVGRAALRSRYDLVVVDEYQDTDPGQERLLRALAGDGHDLLVVGDPDQSIYAFRGAEVRGLLDFRDRFPSRDGAPAEVFPLRVSRRAGAGLLAASRSVAARLPVGGSGLADHLRVHRDLQSAVAGDGSVEVTTFPSASVQYAAVADELRREHLEAGTAYGDMAVLVRSGTRSIPGLRRGLGAAGIPVEVAGDELPISAEPAVAPLLLAARLSVDPDAVTPAAVRALLLSPLVGADVAAIRRLGRVLRDEERDLAAGRLPRPADDLIRESVLDPRILATLDDGVAWPGRALSRLVTTAGDLARAGASAHEVLWSLWSATAWPGRLEGAALAGGPASESAHRDLDAVVALFDAAARDADRAPHRGVAAFLDSLESQEIPAGTLSERGVIGGGVRVLTAHRSKGLEWDVVAVVDVQEDSWPDIRPRSPLLGADRLGPDGPADPPSASALLAEERRLFYVAITRARRRLLVTAVDSAEEDGVRPSRFLAELDVPVTHVATRPRRRLTLPALVAALRAVAVDSGADPALRAAAISRLGWLARETAGGVPIAPQADPAHWWGVADLTDPGVPMHPPGDELALSPSSLSSLADCGLRWFLDHEARAASASSTAQGFGKVVHALAAEVARGTVPAEALVALLDGVWDALAFGSPWQSDRERTEAQAALRRFLAWHAEDADRRAVVAVEARFDVTVSVAGRPVRVRGAFDRVSVEADGRVVITDLKTGRNIPTEAEVDRHVQLGVYQWAVQHGGLDVDVVASVETGTGAELVHLRKEVRGQVKVQQQPALAADEDGTTWVDAVLDDAVAVIEAEDYRARRNQYCDFCDFRGVCPLQEQGRPVLS